MKTLAAIPLVADGLAAIPLSGYPNPVAGVLVDNQSGYNLTVTTPSGTESIGPGIKDYVPVTSNQGQLTVVAGASQGVTWANPQIVPTIVYTTDPVPTGYPTSTTQQVSIVGGTVEVVGSVDISGGTVAVSGGSIEVASGTIDISGVPNINLYSSESALLATIAVNDVGPLDVDLPSWVNSIELLFNNPPNSESLEQMVVTGTTTGYNYFHAINGLSQGHNYSPIAFDVAPLADSTLAFNWHLDAADKVLIIGRSVAADRGQPATPDVVGVTDPVVRTTHIGATVIATLSTQPLLPAPQAGFCYDIKTLVVNVASTVAGVALAYVAYHGNNNIVILGGQQNANGVFVSGSYVEFFIDDGLDFVNGINVAGRASVSYRSIPLISGLN